MSLKYSSWQRIDLHIHTDWSKRTKENDYAGVFSVETLHSKLVQQGVKIFSLTDHNIINLPAYEEYYTKYDSDADPLLLLGVELDISRKNKTYHSLVIFNHSNYEKAYDISHKLEETYTKKNANLKERTLSIDEIVKLFPEDDFFLIPHAGNTASVIDSYRGEIEEAQKMIILFQSPLEKVPEKKRQVFNEQFDRQLYKAFRNKEQYAYIEFSDNHNIQDYPCTHMGGKGEHDFYYVKGSKNYETLRLAFIDPKSRIKSTPDFNSINQSTNYIEALEIESANISDKTQLDFSPHLNVIIGGRSSGKSLLMDILSRSIYTLKGNEKYDEITKGLEVRIKSKFDDSSSAKTSFDPDIVQINQGDIVNYFENKELKSLAKRTERLDRYSNAKGVFSNKKDELEELISRFNEAYENVFDLDMQKQVLLHKHTIEKVLSGEFTINVNRSSIESCHETLINLNSDRELIDNLIGKLDDLGKAKHISFETDEKELIAHFKSLMEKKQKEIESSISVRECIDAFLDNVTINISQANSNLTNEGQEKASAQEAIEQMEKNLRKLFKALVVLNRLTSIIKNYNCGHQVRIELDSESTLCLEVHHEEDIDVLIMDGIRDANDQSLYLCLLALLRGDRVVKHHLDNEPKSLKKKTGTLLSDLLEKLENPIDYLEYGDGSSSKNNSPGYNSEKYLEVILRNPSSELILIDQPEDNLGNKFIAEKLVELIRDLKFKKQIFLVTHNPAIVVYGDAESIILAKNNNNKISYSQIKLEDEASQREICGELDGGEYIFDNRAKKYNIQRLLLNTEDGVNEDGTD